MPLLLVLAIVAVCYPFPWQSHLPLGPWGHLALMLALVLLNISLAAFNSRNVVNALDHLDSKVRVRAVRRFHLLRKILGYWNLLSTIGLITLGWGWTVWQHLLIPGPNGSILCPGAELLVPAPYFLTLFFNWAIYWYAETQIEQTRTHVPRWPLASYWFFQFRKFVIVVLLPTILMIGFQGLNRAMPQVVNWPGFQILSILGVVGLMLILPRFIKMALGWQRLPDGPARTYLEATARRLGLSYTDILLWHTSGSMVNAMVSGLVGWARYIVFTDRILEQMRPEELDAILGHELGHIKYYHIPYYTLFFMVSAFASATLFVAIPFYFGFTGESISAEVAPWLALPAFALMGVYYFIFFGLLSRRCERQADIFGCRAGSCANPHCTGHDEQTELVPAGNGLCRTGVLNMMLALDRVGVLNGVHATDSPTPWQRLVQWFQAWQHGPIRNRIQFLERLAEHPELANQHDAHVRWFRWLLMLALVGLVILGGTLMGWSEFWRML